MPDVFTGNREPEVQPAGSAGSILVQAKLRTWRCSKGAGMRNAKGSDGKVYEVGERFYINDESEFCERTMLRVVEEAPKPRLVAVESGPKRKFPKS